MQTNTITFSSTLPVESFKGFANSRGYSEYKESMVEETYTDLVERTETYTENVPTEETYIEDVANNEEYLEEEIVDGETVSVTKTRIVMVPTQKTRIVDVPTEMTRVISIPVEKKRMVSAQLPNPQSAVDYSAQHLKSIIDIDIEAYQLQAVDAQFETVRGQVKQAVSQIVKITIS